MDQRCPYVLDINGTDIQAEGARLREEGSVRLVELPSGVRCWAITGYDQIRELLNDPRVSKDPRQHWPQWIDNEIPEDWPLRIWVSVQNMFTSYGADHRRLRSLVSTAFTARRTQALRPRIEAIATDLLDAMDNTAPVDLRAHYAYPLPVEVICQLFGIPADDREELRTVVDAIFDTTLTPEQHQANSVRMYELMAKLVPAKRAAPADDLTSALLAVRDDGDGRLAEPELVDTLLLLLTAGHETTVNLLDQAIVALLRHPEQLALVRDGSRTWSDVVEETLRWQAPVAYLPLRYAVEDLEVDGVRIAKGEPILAAYAAAGQDPDRYGPTAGEFDITRADKHHLAFGNGVHHCLGAPLARLEAEIALPALFARFPAMELAVPATELVPMPSFLSNGHRTIPVNLGASAGGR